MRMHGYVLLPFSTQPCCKVEAQMGSKSSKVLQLARKQQLSSMATQDEINKILYNKTTCS